MGSPSVTSGVDRHTRLAPALLLAASLLLAGQAAALAQTARPAGPAAGSAGSVSWQGQPLATLLAAVIAVCGVFTTAAVTYLVAVAKVRQELEVDSDKNLRTQRIEAYKSLWALQKPLARYPQPAPFGYKEAEELSEGLRDWYFEKGGLFLSERVREVYFDLQDGLKVIFQKRLDNCPEYLRDPVDPTRLRACLERGEDWTPPEALVQIAIHPRSATEEGLPMELSLHLLRLSSALRTGLTEDVLTRKPLTLAARVSKRRPARRAGPQPKS